MYNCGQYLLNQRLIIFNNNLFFNISGQTKYINLENINYINDYNYGILYSIQNGKLIYYHQGNMYKAEYYPSTLAIKNIKTIASGSFNFMCEDKDNLYFFSDNEDDSKSIFSISKEGQNLNIMDRYYLDDAKKLNIICSTQSGNNVYIVTEKIIENISKLEKVYDLKIINKGTLKKKTVSLSDRIESFLYTSNDDAFFKLNNNIYKYNYKKNEIIDASNEKALKDIYELKINGKNIELYKNDKLFATILRGTENKVSNIKVIKVGEYIYIQFDLFNNDNVLQEYMFWRIKQDGTNLERINNTF